MNNHDREKIRQALLDSYKHRIEKDCACALCGKENIPLAFHILESSFDEGSKMPLFFVPMSSSRGRVRGSYPICNSCAPACNKCQLPIPTDKVMEFGYKLRVETANGICQHIQMRLLLLAIFKRVFRIGRFGNRA